MKSKILELRSQGKSYREIQKELGCSKSTISYHCGDGQKEKTKERTQKNRDNNSLLRKVENFKTKARKGIINKSQKFQLKSKEGIQVMSETTMEFDHHDVLKKIGDNPICYLTGRPIDLNDPKTFHLDHIIPVSRSGNNSIDNLALACKEANIAKSNLLNEEFIELCLDVVKHHGYTIM